MAIESERSPNATNFRAFYGVYLLKRINTASHCVATISGILLWSECGDLNPGPLDPQSSTLPTAPHPDVLRK